MGSLLISSALPPEGASRMCGVETVTLQNGLVTEKITANLGEESELGQLLSKKQAPRSSQQAAVHLWVTFALPSGSAGQNVLETSHPSPKSTERRLAAAPCARSPSLLPLFLSVVHSMSVFLYQCIRREYLI